jgi:hypothetical protein
VCHRPGAIPPHDGRLEIPRESELTPRSTRGETPLSCGKSPRLDKWCEEDPAVVLLRQPLVDRRLVRSRIGLAALGMDLARR